MNQSNHKEHKGFFTKNTNWYDWKWVIKNCFWIRIKSPQSIRCRTNKSAYEECLYYEITKAGVYVEKQKGLPLVYNEINLDIGYRIDLIIENKLIVEVKSVEVLADIHMAQILTYLKLSKCKLGLLINFNTVLFKDGVKRVINGTLWPLW